MLYQVIRLVRVTRHYCNVDFDLRHYEDLLCLHYQCDSSTQQKEALDAIRGVKNVSYIHVPVYKYMIVYIYTWMFAALATEYVHVHTCTCI